MKNSSVYPAFYQQREKQEEHHKDKHDPQSRSQAGVPGAVGFLGTGRFLDLFRHGCRIPFYVFPVLRLLRIFL